MPFENTGLSEIPQRSHDALLRTKLHRPVARGNFVCRPRLHERLNQGLDTPLTLISAPAGYGKSLLVSHWVESRDVPSAWLSLDESDSAVDIFVDYLLAAVETVVPDACPQTRRMARAADPPTLSVLGDSLVNELDVLGSPLVLVLDDYHRIPADSEVHGLLRQLLAHPPQPLHLVIVSRRDPPLNLTNLRAKGQLTEVRLQDLRFTPAETQALFQVVLQFTISDDALANLQREMEGWPVGLGFVSLALRGVEDRDGFLKNLHGGLQQTQDYLLQEVIAAQPPALRGWLMQTSTLDRFCADLCDAVGKLDGKPESGGLSGMEFLRTLQDRNLFTIGLDNQGTWFRYHHLFRDLLQAELEKRTEPAAIAALHRRASEWSEQQGLVGEAMRYALKAQDTIGAAEIFDRHRRIEQDRDGWRNVEKWLAALPVELKEKRPGLLLGQAWILHDRYQLGGIAPIVERLESFGGEEALDRVSLGELRFFEGVLQFWAGNGDLSRKLCEEARARVPETHPRIAGLIEIYLALANYIAGQGDEALRRLNDKIQDGSFLTGPILSRLILARSFLHMLSGALMSAAQDAGSVVRIARQSSIAYIEGWGRYLEGASHYHRNDLEATVACFAPTLEHRYTMHTRSAVDAMMVLALTHQAMQQPDLADEAMNRLLEFTGELRDAQHLSVARSGQARLALLRGERESAVRWLRSFDGQPAGPEMFIWLEVPSVTQARVLVALASEESLQQASELLATLRDAAEAQHNVCQTIGILALQSLALEQLGRDEEALGVLERALVLAEPGGWVRPFVEPGRAMVALLQRVGGRLQDRSYVERLLRTFPEQVPPVTAGRPAGDGLHGSSATDLDLVEPLTTREEQILELLTRRLRDKEIAARLSISTQTVNFHLKNLYRKLGVSNRREAAAKATGH